MKARCKMGYRVGMGAGPVYYKDEWYEYYTETHPSGEKLYHIIDAYIGNYKQENVISEEYFDYYFDSTQAMREEKINLILQDGKN